MPIASNERLGRGVFSRRHAFRITRGGSVPWRIFSPPRERNSIFVDLLDRSTVNRFTRIQVKNATLSNRQFYGWCSVLASTAASNGRAIREDPTESNPHHAEIDFPIEDHDESMRFHAMELARDATWIDRA